MNNGAGTSNAFIQIGDRGNRGQSSTSGIDRNNIQFFTLVQQNAVGCWNIDQPYFQDTIDVIAQDNTTLVFPNDLKIDRERDQVFYRNAYKKCASFFVYYNWILLFFFFVNRAFGC